MRREESQGEKKRGRVLDGAPGAATHAGVPPGTLLKGKMEQNGRQVRMDSWAEMSQHLSEPATGITSWLPQGPRLVGGRKEGGGRRSSPARGKRDC